MFTFGFGFLQPHPLSLQKTKDENPEIRSDIQMKEIARFTTRRL